jgi:hypothetical protein
MAKSQHHNTPRHHETRKGNQEGRGGPVERDYTLFFDKIVPDMTPGEVAKRLDRSVLYFGVSALREQVEAYADAKRRDPTLAPHGVVAKILANATIKLVMQGLGCEHQQGKQKIAVITATALPNKWYRGEDGLPYTVTPVKAAMEAIAKADAVIRSLITYGRWAQKVLEACSALRTPGETVALPEDIGEIPEFGTYHKWVYGCIWRDAYIELKKAVEAVNEHERALATSTALTIVAAGNQTEPEEVVVGVTTEQLEENLVWVEKYLPEGHELRSLRDLTTRGAVTADDAVTAIKKEHKAMMDRKAVIDEAAAQAQQEREQFLGTLKHFEDVAPDGDDVHAIRDMLDKGEVTLEQAEQLLTAYLDDIKKKEAAAAEPKQD